MNELMQFKYIMGLRQYSTAHQRAFSTQILEDILPAFTYSTVSQGYLTRQNICCRYFI